MPLQKINGGPLSPVFSNIFHLNPHSHINSSSFYGYPTSGSTRLTELQSMKFTWLCSQSRFKMAARIQTFVTPTSSYKFFSKFYTFVCQSSNQLLNLIILSWCLCEKITHWSHLFRYYSFSIIMSKILGPVWIKLIFLVFLAKLKTLWKIMKVSGTQKESEML